jgi:LPS O-antigen subunit length determinant protein (WzzB/FepE family)
VEFDALMEDVEPDWREFADILGGAVKLQMQSETAYLMLIGATAVLGVIASAGLSLVAPGRYVSSAVLRVNPPKDAGNAVSKEMAARQATQHLEWMYQELVSRSSLAELIQRPSLDLYRAERQRVPMEDVIQKMRRDIEIRSVHAASADGFALSVSFAYANQFKAQVVARELTQRLLDSYQKVNRDISQAWQYAWHENAPPGETVEILRAAGEPLKTDPNLAAFVAWGLGAGLVLGALVASVIRRPKLALQLAAFAVGGCVIGAAASFLFPAQYISSAVMRVRPPIDPKRWYAGRAEVPVAQRVQEWEKAALSRESLAQMINGDCKKFYERQLASMPLDEIITNMRDRDIRIEMVSNSTFGQFRISFTADGGRKAQAVVEGLVNAVRWNDVIEQRERAKQEGEEFRLMSAHNLGEILEVLDPASLPETPVSPNRAAMAGAGFVGGLLLGAIARWVRRPRGPAMADAITSPAS